MPPGKGVLLPRGSCRTSITPGCGYCVDHHPDGGSRIRDVLPADWEVVYRPSVERPVRLRLPFRYGRFCRSLDLNVLNIAPIAGRRLYPSATPKKIHRRRHACEL
jgi:hypothetical protein